MEPFRFESASNLDGAFRSHARSDHASFIAGGTTLVDLMKLHVEKPDSLVDIGALPLKTISEDPSAIRIGAMVTNTDLALHPLVTTHMPFLAEAVLSGASPQLRNMASVGGNLLQRTRCPYFRDTTCRCNKREPGSGCDAIEGFNRSHAVLGVSDKCIAAHASDMCLALAAIDAKIHVQGPKGVRVIPISDFYRKPGDDPRLENSLREHELITQVELPKNNVFKSSRYVKIRDRASYAFALVSAAVAVRVTDGIISEARVALGGVGTVPWRALEAESVLRGKPYSENLARTAADEALRGAHGGKYNAFKVDLGKRTLVRALNEVVSSQSGGHA